MRRILVTGGAGFIGSALADQIISTTDDELLVLDKLTYAANAASLEPLRASARFRFVEGDVCDDAVVGEVFRAFRPDWVLHLAAESHVDRSIDKPGEFIRTNVLGVHVMLEAALRHWRELPAHRAESFRFVNVSTDEVFGTLGPNGCFSESSPYAPNSPYSASKAGGDHLVRAWNRTFGLPTLVTFGSNTLGPRQFPEKLIPLTIINALEGRSLPVYGSGENIRDWIYVEDHARAILKAAQFGRIGETYAIGANAERRNIDVVGAICDLVDEMAPDESTGPRRNLISFVADRPGHDLRYASDASRLRAETDWAPRENFESGLRKTVRWYIDNPSWWRRANAQLSYRSRQGIAAR